MIAGKIVCKTKQSLAFILLQFIEAVLVTFVPIVFLVDTLFITIIISSHLAIDVLFKYLLFSKMHVLGIQL